jgi:hypothetical protein
LLLSDMLVPYGLNRSHHENPLYPPDVDIKRHVTYTY